MKNNILFIIGFLFGKIKLFKLGLVLQHVSHRMMGIGNYENKFVSGEKYVVQTIKKFYKKNNFVFFDVGAGEESENLDFILEKFPKTKAYLFEPMPKTYAKLQKNYKNYKNVYTYNLALSNKKGYLKLYDYKNSQTEHATIYKKYLQLKNMKIDEIIVKKTTLFDFLEQNKFFNINFLKIDTEGQEYRVLIGLKGFLSKIDFIQFEFNTMNLYSKKRFKDFFDLFKLDFKLYRIYQDGLLEIKKYDPISQEIYEFQNYLAINKKYDN